MAPSISVPVGARTSCRFLQGASASAPCGDDWEGSVVKSCRWQPVCCGDSTKSVDRASSSSTVLAPETCMRNSRYESVSAAAAVCEADSWKPVSCCKELGASPSTVGCSTSMAAVISGEQRRAGGPELCSPFAGAQPSASAAASCGRSSDPVSQDQLHESPRPAA